MSLIQRNDRDYRLFGNRRLHALGSLAGVIGRLLDAVPDGILTCVGAFREIGGVEAVLAQGVFHRHTGGVNHRPSGNQHLLSAVVGQCCGSRRGCNLRDRLVDGRLDGGAGVGNVVVFEIIAGDLRARYIYGHRFIHPGIFIIKGAGQTFNLDDIPGQNTLLHNSVDRGGIIAVIVLILRRHSGGDGLLTRSKRPGRGGVRIVGLASLGVRAGFGGFHRGFSIANDGDLSAVWAHRCHGRAVNRYDLPGDKAVTRTSKRFQSKTIPVGDGIGLFGDRQGRLLPEGNFKGDLNRCNVIVAARFIGNDCFCRITLGAHVPIVDIRHLVLGVRQNGRGVHARILDRDRRLLILVIVLEAILRQGNHGRDRLAQDFHAADLRRIRSWFDVVAGQPDHFVPDRVVSPRAGSGGNCDRVGTVFIYRKLDFQAVCHRHRFQRTPGDQLLGGTVIGWLGGGRGRVDWVDWMDHQRNGLTGGRLIVRPFRECDHNVISTGVGGQAVCVGIGVPLGLVRIPKPVVQVHTGRRLYIDDYRRQIILLHRTAVIVYRYRDGYGRNIPFQNRRFQLGFCKRVVLCKDSVVCFTGNGNRNGKTGLTDIGPCFIGHSVIGIQNQIRCGIFHPDRDGAVFGLDGFVKGQNL